MTTFAALFLVASINSSDVDASQLVSEQPVEAIGHCDGPRPDCDGGTVICMCDRHDNCAYVCLK